MSVNKNMTPCAATAGIAAACALCACLNGTTAIEQRIGQRPGAFAGLTSEQQARARLGHIQIGDPTNMLWIALGDPDATGTLPASARLAGVDPAEVENAGLQAFETWTYIRDSSPLASGPQPPPVTYQPGAMFAANPPPPPRHVEKTYILANGEIVDIGN